ncbi:hypothetical protein GS467_06475 [Rhodococcus hoagii]|nr:hypothetical protein [Prescottella equi]
MTGSTEHLEQLVRDMEDAGPGATESRTYRAIVAELERRANEKAPAENPVAATAGDEGQTHPNQQEGTDPMTTVQAPAGDPHSSSTPSDGHEDPRWAEFAERDRKVGRLLDAANRQIFAMAAPYWFVDEPPVFDAVLADEPIRAWERSFDEPSDSFGVRLYAEDMLTADGLVRSPVEVLVDTGPDGLTPAAGRQLADAIARAVAALEGGGQ